MMKFKELNNINGQIIKTSLAIIAREARISAANEAAEIKKAARKAERAAKTAARKARQALRDAETQAIKLAWAEAAREEERAAALAAELAAVFVGVAGNGEMEYSIPAVYPVTTGMAEDTRSSAIYGGDGTPVQGAIVTLDGVTWVCQTLADSLMAREGCLPPAKWQYGFNTVKKAVWQIRMDGITDAILPLKISGVKFKEALAKYICERPMPIFMITDPKTMKTELVFWRENEIVLGDGTNIDGSGFYIPDPSMFGFCEEPKYLRGENYFTLEDIDNLIITHNDQITLKGAAVMPIVRTFFTGPDTPSTQRKNDYVLFRVDNPDPGVCLDPIKWQQYLLSLPKSRKALIDKIGANLDTILDATYKNRELSASEVVKKVGRESLLFTTSARGSIPRAMAFLTGKFRHLGIEFADGFGFVNESLIHRSLEAQGFEDLQNVEGLGFQSRVAASKGYCLTVSKFSMETLIKATIEKMVARGNLDCVRYIDIDDANAVREAALGIEGKKDEFRDKLIIIAPKAIAFRQIEYFADSNMLKAAFDFDKVIEVSLMEMCHASHGITTSGQMLECAAGTPAFIKSALEIGKEHIDKIFERSLSAGSLAIEDLSNFDGFADGVVAKVNPDFIFKDEARVKALMRTIGNHVAKDVDRLNFNIEGAYLKAVPDLGGFFGTQLLQSGEVYSPDCNKGDKEQGFVLRYPHTFGGEFIMVNILTKKDLLQRIQGADLNDKHKKCLIRMIRTLKKGQVILPSINPSTVKKLGGSDFDGDGVMLVTDQRVLQMYKHLKEQPVYFDPADSMDKLTYNDLSMEQARHYGLKNGNKTTGGVVVLFYALKSLCLDLSRGFLKEEDWKEFIVNGFNRFNNEAPLIPEVSFFPSQNIKLTSLGQLKGRESKEVVGHASRFFEIGNRDDIEVPDLWNGSSINEEDIRNFLGELREKRVSFFNLKNLQKVLKVIDPAGASVVGRIIDAMKTGEKVSVPFAFFMSFIRNGADIPCVTDENGYLKLDGQTGFSTTWKEKPRFACYVTQSPCFDLKRELAEYTNAKMSELLATKLAPAKAPITNYSRCESVRSVAKSMAMLCTSLLTTQVKSDAEDVFVPQNILTRYAVGMLRHFTASWDYDVRYQLAKDASWIEKDRSGYGRFYQMLGAESILTALQGSDREIFTPLYAKKARVTAFEGEKINLAKGKNDRFFTNSKIFAAGTASFKDGKLYMVSSLEEMCDEAIANSIAQKQVVFKVKFINGLDANKYPAAKIPATIDGLSASSGVAAGIKHQVKAVQALTCTPKVVKYEMGDIAAPGGKENPCYYDRITVDNMVACFVYDHSVKGDRKVSQYLNGKSVKIDYAVQIKGGEVYIFGSLIK